MSTPVSTRTSLPATLEFVAPGPGAWATDPAGSGGQVFFVPPARDRAIEHGYGWLEIPTRLGCSVTTVHRRVRACGDGGRSPSALAAGGKKKT